MKFKNLTQEDKDYILQQVELMNYGNSATLQLQLGEKYNAAPRTIRSWISLLKEDKVKSKPLKRQSPARILILDIETAPLKSYIWGLWNQNIGHNTRMLLNDWFMLSWSAKWLFEEKVYGEVITPEEVATEDDERIVRGLYKLVNEADIVIAHNGQKFDIKRFNTRFLKWGLHPPSPYQNIDTLLHLRKQFAISSNKLGEAAKFLGIPLGKVDTGGFDLWARSMQGDPEALQQMQEYNDGDVLLLEEIYLRIRSWIKPHPNMGLFIKDDVHSCPTCSSTNLSWHGNYNTYVNTYRAFRCDDCGSQGRSRVAELIRSRKNLTTSLP